MTEIEQNQNIERTKVLIVDSQNLSRDCIKSILEKYDCFHILEEATTGEQAIELANRLEPNVILLKDSLSDMPGTKVCNTLKYTGKPFNILMMASQESESCLMEALAAGAHGYFNMDMNLQKLINAIQVITNGDLWIESSNAGSVLKCAQHYLSSNPGTDHVINTKKDSLTTREMEVLSLVAEGKSNNDISKQLEISLHTTKSHIRNILTKLKVSDRSQAANVLITSIKPQLVNSN